MRYLLDTNAWLWMVGSSETLGEGTRVLLSDSKNELYLSAASVWEVVIKAQIGKLRILGEPDEFVRSRLRLQQVAALPISLDHVLAVSHLPVHHRDPFDRIIVAQAFSEDLILVTSDRRLGQYPVVVHDARL